MSTDSDRITQLEADLAAVWERKRELDALEVDLRAMLAAQQLVIDAADEMCRVKREAAQATRGVGLEGMLAAAKVDPGVRALADAMPKAGKRLEQAVEIYRARYPR